MSTNGRNSEQMEAIFLLLETISNKWTLYEYSWKQFRTNGRYDCTHGSNSEQMDAMTVLMEAIRNDWTLFFYFWKEFRTNGRYMSTN